MKTVSKWLVICVAALAAMSAGAECDIDVDSDDGDCIFFCD